MGKGARVGRGPSDLCVTYSPKKCGVSGKRERREAGKGDLELFRIERGNWYHDEVNAANTDNTRGE